MSRALAEVRLCHLNSSPCRSTSICNEHCSVERVKTSQAAVIPLVGTVFLVFVEELMYPKQSRSALQTASTGGEHLTRCILLRGAVICMCLDQHGPMKEEEELVGIPKEDIQMYGVMSRKA